MALFRARVGIRALVVDLVLTWRVHERLDPNARKRFRLFSGIVRLFAWLRRSVHVFVHNAFFLPARTPVKLVGNELRASRRSKCEGAEPNAHGDAL
jgi:hypothetical protein